MLFPLEEGDALRGDFAPANCLAVAFDASSGGMAPWTRIGWRAAGGPLQVETVHTYPEEGRGVRRMAHAYLRATKP